MNSIQLVVTDLDNTLFDWVEIWYRSFSAMLAELVRISGVSESELIPQIKAIHQKYGTSEYAFLIEEIPAFRERYPHENLLEKFDPAIHAFRSARKEYLKLYPTVLDSLKRLKGSGVAVVGYTESMAYYSSFRIKRLGLDGLLDFVYSPKDHDIPRGLTPEQLRRYPANYYELQITKHRSTPAGRLKPDPDILLNIISDCRFDRDRTVYIGDSLMKDIAMAEDARIASALAEYGVAHRRQEYELLRAVTHWTEADVKREKEIKHEDVQPSAVLKATFSEVFDHFEFGDKA